MKFVVYTLFLFLFSNAYGAVKISTHTCTTDAITGECTVSIKIPGTFTTIDYTNSSWSGRTLLRAGLWLEGRAAGDRISEAYVSDVDSKIPVPAQALFPNYPVLRNLHDDLMSSGNQGIVMPPGGLPFQIEFPANNAAKMASELYLKIKFKKAVVGVDTATVNISMDDGT